MKVAGFFCVEKPQSLLTPGLYCGCQDGDEGVAVILTPATQQNMRKERLIFYCQQLF